MPGLNAIVCFDAFTENDKKNLSESLKKMNYDRNYSHNFLIDDENFKLALSAYDIYPCQKFEIEGYAVVMEGAIYNKKPEEIKRDIKKFANSISSGKPDFDGIRNFMFETDGEYVFYIYDKRNGQLIIFNDGLGRLPVYHHRHRNKFLIGRAMKFVTGNVAQIQIDDQGITEYYLHCVPFGNRTYLKDVFRLMPCSLITVDIKAKIVDLKTLHKYNFDERWEDRPLDKCVADLHDLFLEGVKNRVAHFSDRKHILSLSGGLDSRTNLMGLLKAKANFQCLTFNDAFKQFNRDWPVVDELVKQYGLDHRHISLIEENIPYFEKNVTLKDGTALMATMGSVVYSMEITEKEFGRNICYYIGDEGNYITAPRYFGTHVESVDKVVDETIAKDTLCVYSINEVADILGKDADSIRKMQRDYFETYPEKNNVHKIDHFFIWERSFKFTMENQDRVRHFFWPLAPHYSIPYTRYALKVPNKFLAGWKLYAGLLKALDKDSLKVKYGNFGIRLDSPLMSYYLPIKKMLSENETFRRKFIWTLRLLMNPSKITKRQKENQYGNSIREYIKGLLANDKVLKSYFRGDKLDNILAGDKYTLKYYISSNIIKYLSTVPNKTLGNGKSN